MPSRSAVWPKILPPVSAMLPLWDATSRRLASASAAGSEDQGQDLQAEGEGNSTYTEGTSTAASGSGGEEVAMVELDSEDAGKAAAELPREGSPQPPQPPQLPAAAETADFPARKSGRNRKRGKRGQWRRPQNQQEVRKVNRASAGQSYTRGEGSHGASGGGGVSGSGGAAVGLAHEAAAAAGALSEHRGIDENDAVVVVDRGGEEERDGNGQGDEEECEEIGPCVWCDRNELGLEYCKDTGRRQEVRCAKSNGDVDGQAGNVGSLGVLPSTIKYRACVHAEEDDVRGLLHFWLLMLTLGVLACIGMRRRQQKGGSLYDRRAK